MKPKDLAPAENENKTEPETEDREQSNEANKDKNPSNDKGDHGDVGAITKARCGPDSVGVKYKAIIPHPTTRDEAEGQQKTVCNWTPDTELAVGATAQLSRRETEAAVGCKTQAQEESVVYVNPSLADLAGNHNTGSDLAGAEAVSPHGCGPGGCLHLPLGDLRLLPAAERLDRGATTGATVRAAAGKGEEEEGNLEVEMKSFLNTQGAMSNVERSLQAQLRPTWGPPDACQVDA